MKSLPIFLIRPFPSATSPVEDALAAVPGVAALGQSHVLTPLAYLGYYDKVFKAPYDPVLAVESQRLFVAGLPGGEQDYIAACRAYADTMYECAAAGADWVLDSTAHYVHLLPFLQRIYPDAVYVVVMQTPLAHLATVSPSELAATRHTLTAVATLLARLDQTVLRVRLEDWATDSSAERQRLLAALGPGAVALPEPDESRLPNDWAIRLARDPAERQRVRGLLRRLYAHDLAVCGYPMESIWNPVVEALGQPIRPVRTGSLSRVRHALWTQARRAARHAPRVNKLLRKARLACDVLLRD